MPEVHLRRAVIRPEDSYRKRRARRARCKRISAPFLWMHVSKRSQRITRRFPPNQTGNPGASVQRRAAPIRGTAGRSQHSQVPKSCGQSVRPLSGEVPSAHAASRVCYTPAQRGHAAPAISRLLGRSRLYHGHLYESFDRPDVGGLPQGASAREFPTVMRAMVTPVLWFVLDVCLRIVAAKGGLDSTFGPSGACVVWPVTLRGFFLFSRQE